MQQLTDNRLDEVAERFKALSEPSRLAILRFLMGGPAPVGVIAEEVGQSQPNASRHLSALKRTGFVTGRRTGQSIIYEISDPTVVALCELMCGSTPPRR